MPRIHTRLYEQRVTTIIPVSTDTLRGAAVAVMGATGTLETT